MKAMKATTRDWATSTRDWARIVLLPLWLIHNVALWPHPTWVIVVETALVTLLVYWAVERRILTAKKRRQDLASSPAGTDLP